jgi:hypothetical protein
MGLAYRWDDLNRRRMRHALQCAQDLEPGRPVAHKLEVGTTNRPTPAPTGKLAAP